MDRGPKTSAERLLLRVSEAAEMCGYSRAFVYQAVARGELPALHLGKRTTRIPAAWLREWVRAKVEDWERATGRLPSDQER